MSQISKINKNFLRFSRPWIAWPTIGLFLCAFGIWLLSLRMGAEYLAAGISMPWEVRLGTLMLSVLATYFQFTVWHESIHHTVSQIPWVNDAVGWMSQWFLGPTSNFWALQHNHLVHHQKTNEALWDPDVWASNAGPGGKKWIWLRWMSMDIAYGIEFVTWSFQKHRAQLVKWILYSLVHWWILYQLFQAGYALLLFWHWLVPARIAIFLLAFTFDYLPHSPTLHPISVSKYLTTYYLSFPPRILQPFFSALIMYQNYHLIHHLYPTVPWYYYKDLWNVEKESLLKRGIAVKHYWTFLGKEKLISSPEVPFETKKELLSY